MTNESGMGRVLVVIAGLALVGIATHLALRWAAPDWRDWPLYAVLLFGGVPLVVWLLLALVRGEFGSDLLAGISIITAVVLGEYLAGALVVLMLSGGQALEAFAVLRPHWRRWLVARPPSPTERTELP